MNTLPPLSLKNAAYSEAAKFDLPNDWQDSRPHIDGLTIDSLSTRDKDDAIGMHARSDGSYDVTISIADVGTFMQRSRAMEKYAQEMGQTRYGRTANITMIPPRVSEGILSILDDREDPTPVISTNLHLDPDGNVGNLEITREALYPRSFTYRDVSRRLAGQEGNAEDQELLNEFQTVAQKLLQQRRNHGSAAFYDSDRGYMVDEEGQVIEFKPGSNQSGQLIVQEFMILANAAMAEYMSRHNIPALYRNHHLRPDANLNKLQDLVRADVFDPKLASQIYARARYSPNLEGHVGLSLDSYMHFTSPLRRYADYVNHRNLVAHLDGKRYPFNTKNLFVIAKHLNDVQDMVRNPAGYREAKRLAEMQLAQTDDLALEPQPKPVKSLPFATRLRQAHQSGVFTVGLGVEAERRFTGGTIDPSQLALLTLGRFVNERNHETVRSNAFAYLQKNPNFIESTLNNAGRMLFDGFKSTVRTRGNIAEATVSFQNKEDEFITITAKARNKQTALEIAGLKLIAQVGGFEYKPPEIEVPISSAAEQEKLPVFNYRNPLDELLRKTTAVAPHFSTNKKGGKYLATLTCTHDGKLLMFTAEGSSNKEAERTAAQQAMETLFPDESAVIARGEALPQLAKMPKGQKAAHIINDLQTKVFRNWGIGSAPKGHPYLPQYSFETTQPEVGLAMTVCTITVNLPGLPSIKLTSEGRNRADAKASAAKLMSYQVPDPVPGVKLVNLTSPTQLPREGVWGNFGRRFGIKRLAWTK